MLLGIMRICPITRYFVEKVYKFYFLMLVEYVSGLKTLKSRGRHKVVNEMLLFCAFCRLF